MIIWVKKYDSEFLAKILKDKGLTILGEVKTSNNKVLCKTQEGYLVFAVPLGIIRRNDTPLVFSKYNPYTIYNIKIWLKNNNINSIELLSDVYVSSTSKLKWLCKNCGKEFEASWDSVLQGKRYCNFCAKNKRFDGYKDYTLEISNECEKRGYKLITQYVHRCTDDFEYICNKHKEEGVQHSYYDRFINCGQGCKYCGIESRGYLHRTQEDEIKELVESKGFIYHGVNYDNGDKKYKKANIEIICPNHKDKGVQVIKYNNLLKSVGHCAYCVGRNRSKEDLQNEIDRLKLSVTILEYQDFSSPIKVVCNNCGHEWLTKGSSLIQGHSCPNCRKSKFETEVQSILEYMNIKYISQYRFNECRDINPLPFDFYLPELNILIEVDGEGHYIPIPRTSDMSEDEALKLLYRTQFHDKIKTQYCIDNNIRLIRIPYWERKNIKKFLAEKI